MALSRRKMFGGLVLALAAPAIIPSGILMPVKPLPLFPSFVEAVGFPNKPAVVGSTWLQKNAVSESKWVFRSSGLWELETPVVTTRESRMARWYAAANANASDSSFHIAAAGNSHYNKGYGLYTDNLPLEDAFSDYESVFDYTMSAEIQTEFTAGWNAAAQGTGKRSVTAAGPLHENGVYAKRTDKTSRGNGIGNCFVKVAEEAPNTNFVYHIPEEDGPLGKPDLEVLDTAGRFLASKDNGILVFVS